MSRQRDPIQRVADDARDLYDVVGWEERSFLDRASTRIYSALVSSARVVVVLVALLLLVAQLALVGVATIDNQVVGVFILLSVVPALALAAYVRRVDVTSGEPVHLLLVTFLLGFLLASFAAVLNSALQGGFQAIPLVGMALFFFLVVGPVEETVKWLAVRLFAYRSDEFDAVVDGAVYGAFAGLGFATIENSLYITREFLNAAGSGPEVVVGTLLPTAAVRTFAGPGHVIYSGFAGYYLGLAKFNPTDRGPIIVKGLLIAALIHGFYNTSVTYLPLVVDLVPPLAGLSDGAVFLGFVVVFDGVFGYVLYRKLSRYRRVYRELGAAPGAREADPDGLPAVEEFDPESRVASAQFRTGSGVDATAPPRDGRPRREAGDGVDRGQSDPGAVDRRPGPPDDDRPG